MEKFKKYWATVLSFAGAAFYFLLPSMQAYVDSHPKTQTAILLAFAVAAFHSRAPKDKQ